MLLYMLTGVVNLLTFMSVTITTGDDTSLLSAIFLFSASIGLEALSLWHDSDRKNSKIVFISFCVLSFIFVAGWFLAIFGYANFIDFHIDQSSPPPRVVVGIPQRSFLMPSTRNPLDITLALNLCGTASIIIPFILASRIRRITTCREQYDLQQGFLGK